MKVTIAVPIYGVEKYIERCARSLFEQTYKNIEYIFVNDCTKDNSISILERILNEYPHRKPQVRIITHEKNRGLGAARNTAVDASTGDYIFHVDSDDYIDLTTIEKCVDKQKESGADIISCNAYYDYGNTIKPCNHVIGCSSNDWKTMLVSRHSQIMIWGRLIRLSLYKQNQIFVYEGYNMGEDFQVMPKLAYYANLLELVDENLYFYNKQSDISYSSNFSSDKATQTFASIDILADFFKDKESMYLDELKKAQARLVAEVVLWCCRCGEKEFYNSVLKKYIREIEKKYYKSMNISFQIVYRIPYKWFLFPYALLGHRWKMIMRRFTY